MNKNLQKEILLTIKTINEEKGTLYNQILFDIQKKYEKLGYNTTTINTNLQLLNEDGLMAGYEKEWHYPYGPALRLTKLGYYQFLPWYKKILDIKKISTWANLIVLVLNIILAILNIYLLSK